jgi:putative transcriptional regulator
MKNQLKVERTKHDMTQADLAQKVNVSRQTIIAIESGRFIPSTVLSLKIAKVLNCRPDEIFFLEEEDWKS